MRITITGAAGFIGSNLCLKMLKDGVQCTGIDKLTDYYNIDQKRANLEPLLKFPNFTFFEKDLREEELKKEFSDTDAVLHFAAQPGVFRSWGENFDVYVENNIKATQYILEILKNRPQIPLIFSSSSSVYGDTDKYPMREDNILRPISPYGLTKESCEKLIELYNLNFGVKFLNLRYFTVFGPSQRPDMAFHKFFHAILKSEPINIYGDGKQIRDFTYVDDVTDFIILLLKKGEWNDTLNIGGGNHISVNEVLEIIFAVSGKRTELKRTGEEKGDMKKTIADISKAKKYGYDPRHSLREGLQNEWEWAERFYR